MVCNPSTKEILRLSVRQGNGRAVLLLRDMSDEQRHECVDMVAHEIENDLRFDGQCNADRTEYNGFLVDSFAGEDREKLRRIYEAAKAKCDKDTAGEAEDSTQSKHESEQPNEQLTVGRIIEIMRESGDITVHPARFRQFFLNKATAEEIETLACAARNEADPMIKARLYSLFSRTKYPFEPDELLDIAKAWESRLTDKYFGNSVTAFNLQYVIANLRHPAVREYGFDMIERAMKAESEEEKASLLMYGFGIWAANYEESDRVRLVEFNEKLPEHDNDPHGVRHNVEYTITHKMFERKYEDPRTYGFLTWVYDNTLCSCCRRKAVEIMSEHGMLKEYMERYVKWSVFDCDPETRRIVEMGSCLTLE